MSEAEQARNIDELAALARQRLEPGIAEYLDGAADDKRTLRANTARFADVGIRARRLVDVATIDTTVEILGERWPSPIALAPVGYQGLFHADAELATARAAHSRGQRFIASAVSTEPIGSIHAAAPGSWFQLYPTPDRAVTARLLEHAEGAGCPVVALTVDVPTLGNRERGLDTLLGMLSDGRLKAGNFPDLEGELTIEDPSMDWSMIDWMRERSSMKIVLKGIVTAEDARRSVEQGVAGIVVSNHGGRQEESDRATIECLPEVAAAVGGRCAVLFDSGIRRGTDVFKALALGADAVCVGRAYVWGLAAGGEAGAGRALDLLNEELVRIMRLAGTPTIAEIGRDLVETAS
ncbi:MAG: alpha-hydroxy-acid oxidizing protein [Acidobacteria bacterium]|nr:alpha-hydroxy-acid oxidizing protein [Acidobacteriota bacterium]NIT10358.1 alpha-hydroxy-acid oxidizing protein [Acidobacteriota bacterium]